MSLSLFLSHWISAKEKREGRRIGSVDIFCHTQLTTIVQKDEQIIDDSTRLNSYLSVGYNQCDFDRSRPSRNCRSTTHYRKNGTTPEIGIFHGRDATVSQLQRISQRIGRFTAFPYITVQLQHEIVHAFNLPRHHGSICQRSSHRFTQSTHRPRINVSFHLCRSSSLISGHSLDPSSHFSFHASIDFADVRYNTTVTMSNRSILVPNQSHSIHHFLPSHFSSRFISRSDFFGLFAPALSTSECRRNRPRHLSKRTTALPSAAISSFLHETSLVNMDRRTEFVFHESV